MPPGVAERRSSAQIPAAGTAGARARCRIDLRAGRDVRILAARVPSSRYAAVQ